MDHDATNLGELEMAIMDYLWEQGPAKVKKAHRVVGISRDITVNTVQSTMKRLWEKGLLERSKESHAYVYRAKISRQELTELVVGQLVEDVTGSKIDVALQAFVNLAEQAGEGTLEKLEQLIADCRAEPQE